MLPRETQEARAQPTAAPADGDYLRWLEERSMLHQARRYSATVSGTGRPWQRSYAAPQTRKAVRRTSVWLLDYPGSVITRPGASVLATWAEPELWDTLQGIGIDLLHTGPLNRAGGIAGKEYTPTTDGWFDPISLEIDPVFGTEEEYRRLVGVAGAHHALIAGDLVPLHTGTGPDFRLAARAYKDYPGMFTMVEIASADWHLLPTVKNAWKGELIPKKTVIELTNKGYLPGLINSNDAAEDTRERSGWSATAPIVGADDKTRRWAYLTFFKRGQPALNWLDPSYAAPRVVMADAVKLVHVLGARVLRLDAVPFTGVEPEDRARASTKHYQHQLSILRTNEMAFMTRRLGGWTFHELNIPLQQLRKYTEHGPDLSYDFFTRAQVLHALLEGDAGPLRLAYQHLKETGVDPISLVHDLQNHDEITYQLVELKEREKEIFKVNDREVSGGELREQLLDEMRSKLAGEPISYTMLYRPEKDGLATTFAGYIAASLGIRDPYRASREEVAAIRRAHLLLAAANAMQPGVFSLSSWDLVGALPVSKDAVARWASDGDHRWINRGGVDLMGFNPQAQTSVIGLPRATSLYGNLREQLKDSDSFTSSIKRLLQARKKHRLAEAELVDVPDVKNKAVCVLVMRLADEAGYAATLLNFGRQATTVSLDFKSIADIAGRRAVDIVTGENEGSVSERGSLQIRLGGVTAKTIALSR